MKVYKIKEGGFNEVRKQMLRKTLPVYAFVLIGGSLMPFFGPANKDGDMSTWPIVLVGMAVVLGFSYYRGINKQRGVFESYTLTISDITVICDQDGRPSISLYHSEVQAIYRNKNGSFTIRGKYPTDVIGVPAQMENYDELEATLQHIKPITANPQKNLATKGLALSLLSIASMVTVVIAYNKIIVSIAAVIFIALAGWGFYAVQTNKNIDTRTKRNSLWLILVIASITYAAIAKVFLM